MHFYILLRRKTQIWTRGLKSYRPTDSVPNQIHQTAQENHNQHNQAFRTVEKHSYVYILVDYTYYIQKRKELDMTLNVTLHSLL